MNEDIVRINIINSIIDKYHMTKDDATEIYESSLVPALLKDNKDYMLHYDFDYWAKYITNPIVT